MNIKNILLTGFGAKRQFWNLSKNLKISKPNDKYLIRRMEKKDIKSALNCLKPLGLTESVSFLEPFMDCDPNAFYVAVTQSDERVIGVCGAPVTSESTGFMGLYGVDTNFQKQGIGRQLFQLCLKHIGDRNCGLFSISSKLFIYESFYNFNVKEVRELIIFGGIPQIENINVMIDSNHEIKELRKDDTNLLKKIIEFDTKVHKNSRNQLLSATLNRLDNKTFVLFDKLNDELLGYSTIRINEERIAIIGPVYSDNDYIAEILIYELLKSCEESQKNGLIYPTLNCCESSHIIARRLGLQEYGSSATRFTKHRLNINSKLIYCIHSPNFSF